MATFPRVDEYRASQRDLVALAYRELLDFWDTLDLTDAVTVANRLAEFVPGLVADYGEIGASLAADFYDELRAEKGFASTFAATMSDPVVPARAVASTRWAVGPLFSADPHPMTALSNVANVVQRFVQEPGRQTIMSATTADPEDVRFARVPSGTKTCPFCLMGASRGAVYASKATAEKDFHGGCNCVAIPVFDDGDLPGGDYDLTGMQAIYRAAKANSDGTLSGITAEIRRQPREAAHLAVEQMHTNEKEGRGAGATLGLLKHDVPKTGYSLAVSGYERVVPTGDALEADVTAFATDHHTVLAGDHRYLGLWENEGQVYLDVVEVWPDRAATVRLAHERGELAIYDLGRGEEIATT